jgi:DNA-binding beta-propeller fold protein YncE
MTSSPSAPTRSKASRIACGAFLLLAALAGGAMAAETLAPPRMQVDAAWPQALPNDWIFGQVSGVAVDAKDHVFVIQRPRSLTDEEKAASLSPPRAKCCRPAPPVLEFDPAGKLVKSWGGPGQGYDWPSSEHGITVDGKGFVWIGGNGDQDGQILKFTTDGKFVLQIGKPGPQTGSNDLTRLGRPAGIAVDAAAREVYVADGYFNRRVIVFDADTGAYKRHWGAYGAKPDDGPVPAYDPKAPPSKSFNTSHCVRLAKDGLVYVCDRINDRIQVFHKDGRYVSEMRIAPETLGIGSVWDLALSTDPGQAFLILADGTNDEIRFIRRTTGEVAASFGRQGRSAGQFHWVHNVAINSKGELFTSEVDTGKRLQRFVPVQP